MIEPLRTHIGQFINYSADSATTGSLSFESFRSKMAAWIFGFLAVGAIFLQEAWLLRVRYNSALNLLFFGFIVWSVRKRLRDFPYKKPACVLIFISFLLPTLVQRPITIAVLSWCFILLLPWRPIGVTNDNKEITGRTTMVVVFGLMAASLGLALFMHVNLNNNFVLIIDDILYILQSNLMTHPGYARTIEPTLRPFFVLKQSVFVDGRFYSQYPPGWPLVLQFFSMMNLRSWTNCLIVPLAIGATYLLGKRVSSSSTGMIAALLVATNSAFIAIGSARYTPHILTLMLAAMSGFLLLRGEDKNAVGRTLGWVGAGFLLGSLVAVRPLTGVAIGFSLVTWLLIRRQLDKKDVKMLAIMFAAGSFLPIAFFLHYNIVTNGDPFTLGYQIANGDLSNLGFGNKGVIVYDEQGNPIEDTIDFTSTLALKQTLDNMYETGSILIPAFVIFPLLLLSFSYGFRFSWRTVIVFLLLPAVHSFYFYPGIRYFVEILPFLCVGVASMLVFLRSRNRSLAASILVFLLIYNLGQTARGIHKAYVYSHEKFFQDALFYFRQVEDLRNQHGKVLVFVKKNPKNEYLFEALYWFNIDNFPGDIVVARDIGERDSVLINRFPEHVPLYIEAHS